MSSINSLGGYSSLSGVSLGRENYTHSRSGTSGGNNHFSFSGLNASGISTGAIEPSALLNNSSDIEQLAASIVAHIAAPSRDF